MGNPHCEPFAMNVQSPSAPRRSVAIATLRLVSLCCLMMVLMSGAASAKLFCVSTGNQLSSAMEEAAFNSQDDEIRIGIGTLTRSGASGGVPRWEYSIGLGNGDTRYGLTVSGGWSDCNTQVADAQLTVLDAQLQGNAMNLALYAGQGTIQISNLTITRGIDNGTTTHVDAANLNIYEPYSSATVVLDRLIIIAGSTSIDGSAGGIYIRSAGDGSQRPTFTLRNSVIAFNTTPGRGGVYINMNYAAVSVVNNSIHSNVGSNASQGDNVGLGLLNFQGNSYVSNNVMYNNRNSQNGKYDFRNIDGNTYLRSNHFGTATMTVAPLLNLNTTTGDPQWTLTGIYPVPNASSPLRDSGYNTPVGGLGPVDAAGNARVINNTVDRGAVEADPAQPMDRIFGNSFD